MGQRVGVLGGTFNPIHYGHLAASEEVLERLHLDLVLFVPSSLPPHKQEDVMPSADRRLEMVRLAIAGNTHFALSDIEVCRGGKSYTIETIEQLRSGNPDAEFFFMAGVDSFHEIRSWHQWNRLLALCSFIVLSRPGYRFSDLLTLDFLKGAEERLQALDREEVQEAVIRTGEYRICLERISHYDISSTDIRKRIREGRSVKYLLPEPVEHYIIENKLYG